MAAELVPGFRLIDSWFDTFRFNSKLRQLRNKKRNVKDEFEEALEKAEQANDREERAKLVGKWFFDCDCFNDEIFSLQTRYLCELADRYLIPTPKFSEKSNAWVESKVSGQWYLSPKAIVKLRTEIHDERKRRRDTWMPWVLMTIGLMSAATGLIAVLTAWFKN